MSTPEVTRRKLRTAVIGLGRAGWMIHLPEIRRHPGFELAAVVDPLAERRAEAERVYGVPAYEDCARLFASVALDLAVIASPTQFHAAHALAAFAAGVDVFCDKPLATGLVEAEQMASAARDRGRRFMCYQPNRAFAETVALRAILAHGLIGRVFMIKRAFTFYRVRADWQAWHRHGGGILMNAGSHFIDQLLYLSGSTVTKLHPVIRRIISRGDAEDVVKLVMETKNGMILDLDLSYAAAVPVTPWHILGERGSVVWNATEASWDVRYCLQESVDRVAVQDTLAATGRLYGDEQNYGWHDTRVAVRDFAAIDYYHRCYAYFVQGEAPFVPIEETLEVLKIIEDCRR
jgi:scyllo-inositol 2-dehydrogenase (NADP+)